MLIGITKWQVDTITAETTRVFQSNNVLLFFRDIFQGLLQVQCKFVTSSKTQLYIDSEIVLLVPANITSS